VRIVEDKGVEAGSVVSQDVSTVGADSLLPLQAALGHEIAQNLSLGPDNTLIEGKPDFTNLQTMREHLTSPEGNGEGKTQHNREWWRFWDRDRR
jgi:hypothetical protein